MNQQPAAVAARSPGPRLPAAAAGSGVICTEKCLGKRCFPFARRGKGHQSGTARTGELCCYHGSQLIAALVGKSLEGRCWLEPGELLGAQEGGRTLSAIKSCMGHSGRAFPLQCQELLCEVAAAAPGQPGGCEETSSSLQICVPMCCQSSGASQHPGANPFKCVHTCSCLHV